MDPKKAREILRKERPDLIDVEHQPSAPFPGSQGLPDDVDRFEAASKAWKKDLPQGDDSPAPSTKNGLSADQIRAMFAPRALGGEPADAAASPAGDVPGIRRVIKRGRKTEFENTADSSGPEAKDLLLDEEQGIIGSQG